MMGVISPQARAAGLKVRRRNAKLRKQGLLPPTKQRRKAESIPLDHPLFDSPPPKGGKPKEKRIDVVRELLLLVLKLL
jgi:hypothetical protein